MKPECVLQAHAICGESPVWDDRRQGLWWTDIHGMRIHGPGGRIWQLDQRVGALALTEAGDLILAAETGFRRFDPATGAVTVLADPETADMRMNDGRCDRAGRFWAGSLRNAIDRPAGALWRFDGRAERMAEGYMVPNGLAFSPDDRTLYHADSRARTVWAYEFDLAEGRLGPRRVFAELAEGEGRPDGAAVDADGGYWIALVTGGRIMRFAPDGRRDRVIEMPVSRPTMCAFGGAGLDTLFVTSGTEHIAQPGPLDGGLFALHVGIAGLPEPRFRS